MVENTKLKLYNVTDKKTLMPLQKTRLQLITNSCTNFEQKETICKSTMVNIPQLKRVEEAK